MSLEVDALQRLLDSIGGRYAKYRKDPVGFCQDVLHIKLLPFQKEIANALLEPPHRVMVRSANAVGKTALTSALSLWFYLCFDPGVCIITSPKFEQIQTTVFKEIRKLYRGPGLLPKHPRIQSSADHYLAGTTANSATAFQGVHQDNVMVIFEESVGIEQEFWTAARGILAGANPDTSFWLSVCNPTDSNSQTYLEEMAGGWQVFSVSALNHPNILAEQTGHPPLVKSAVRLESLRENMSMWGEIIPEKSHIPTDILFEGRWWRPGPEGDARILGRWPTQSSTAIFAEGDFDLAASLQLTWDYDDLPHIGCDVARFGDDSTTIHARRGPVTLLHESYKGKDTAHTTGRLKELAHQLATEFNQDRPFKNHIPPEHVPVKIDDAGIGGAVTDQREKFHFIPVNSANRAIEERKYPNKRSELLFNLALMLRSGEISLANIDKKTLTEIKRQAIGITYKLDAKGKRVAETKSDIKKRINRSPDDLDSMALAYLGLGGFVGDSRVIRDEKPLYGRESRQLMGGGESEGRRKGPERAGWSPM